VSKNSPSVRRKRLGHWVAVGVACYAGAGAVVLVGVALLPEKVQVGVGGAVVAWGVLGVAAAGVAGAWVRAHRRGSVGADFEGGEEVGGG
jgi:hypothetical protein